MKRGFLPIPVLCLLSACSTNITGLSDAHKDFQCKAPDGVLCTSVSGTYANSLENNLPAQKNEKATSEPASHEGERTKSTDATDAGRTFLPRALDAPNSGDPLRVPPLVLRVWVAPWEDVDGDFNDQHYFYTVVHNGRWMIEANRESIRNQFMPVFPLRKPRPEAEHESPGSTAEAVAADGMAQGRRAVAEPSK